MALAVAWIVPLVWGLGSSLWLRRLDVLGLLGVVTYGIALAISVFLHAGALPLKVHRAVLSRSGHGCHLERDASAPTRWVFLDFALPTWTAPRRYGPSRRCSLRRPRLDQAPGSP